MFNGPPCKTVSVKSEADPVSFCSPSKKAPAVPNCPAIAERQPKTGEQIEEGHLKRPADVSFPWHEEVVEHLLKSKKAIKRNQFMVSIITSKRTAPYQAIWKSYHYMKRGDATKAVQSRTVKSFWTLRQCYGGHESVCKSWVQRTGLVSAGLYSRIGFLIHLIRFYWNIAKSESQVTPFLLKHSQKWKSSYSVYYLFIKI